MRLAFVARCRQDVVQLRVSGYQPLVEMEPRLRPVRGVAIPGNNVARGQDGEQVVVHPHREGGADVQSLRVWLVRRDDAAPEQRKGAVG